MNPHILFKKYLGWCPGVASAATFVPDKEIDNKTVIASATLLLSLLAVFVYLDNQSHASLVPELEEIPISPIDYLWVNSFDASENDVGNCVIETHDGGFMVLGYNETFQVGQSVFLAKINPNGIIVWNKTYGQNGYYSGNHIIETTTGYVLTGYSNNSLFLMTVNEQGEIIWEQSFDGKVGKSVRETPNGCLAVLGDRGDDVLLLKTDMDGVVLWSKTYAEKEENSGECLQVTQEGGFIIGGKTRDISSTNTHWDFYIIKTDEQGNTIWSKTLGGSQGDLLNSIIEAQDKSILAVGYRVAVNTGGSAGGADLWVVKMSEDGDILWSKTYPGGSCKDIIQSSDGNCVILTKYNGSLVLHKIDDDGELVWITYVNNTSDIGGNCLIQTVDGEYVIAGSQKTPPNNKNIMILKTKKIDETR